MEKVSKFFSSYWGLSITGAILGFLSPILVFLGNPGNMGFCVACFIRDTVGALGLHRADTVQYIRPELIGLVLGALFASLNFGEFKAKGGSSPIIRFFLGFFAMIGALMFLGCPWRAFLRLGGGDLNALIGIAGLIVGVVIGTLFFKNGFSLGKSHDLPKFSGWIMPMVAVALLVFLLINPLFGKDASGAATGPIFHSLKGPASMVAPILISLGAGFLVGLVIQKSRFCSIGAFRNAIFFKDFSLLIGVLVLIAVAAITNLSLGQFKLGFTDQPIAHTDILWNFGGMLLAGLAFSLAGGCPARMLTMSGEGDSDASIFIYGMAAGAAFGNNFSLAASPKGPSLFGPTAILIGLAFCILVGFLMKEKANA
jgi:hypothetical protein